jgi:hypothetical protein
MRENKFKVQISAGNVLAIVFQDGEGILLVEFLKRGATINIERYVQTLKTLKQRIRRVRPNRKMSQVLFLHDNARRHTSLHTREAIARVVWTLPPHPRYSPDLTPGDFHLFVPLRDTLRGRRFADDEKLKQSVREELRRFSKEFYATSVQRLKQRRRCGKIISTL